MSIAVKVKLELNDITKYTDMLYKNNIASVFRVNITS